MDKQQNLKKKTSTNHTEIEDLLYAQVRGEFVRNLDVQKALAKKSYN